MSTKSPPVEAVEEQVVMTTVLIMLCHERGMARMTKVRCLLKQLGQLGCRPLRIRGSHQRWVTPGGKRFTAVVSHPGSEVTPGVMSKVRRVLRREGLKVGEEASSPSQVPRISDTGFRDSDAEVVR